jgi:hypothetical protein
LCKSEIDEAKLQTEHANKAKVSDPIEITQLFFNNVQWWTFILFFNYRKTL